MSRSVRKSATLPSSETSTANRLLPALTPHTRSHTCHPPQGCLPPEKVCGKQTPRLLCTGRDSAPYHACPLLHSPKKREGVRCRSPPRRGSLSQHAARRRDKAAPEARSAHESSLGTLLDLIAKPVRRYQKRGHFDPSPPGTRVSGGGFWSIEPARSCLSFFAQRHVRNPAWRTAESGALSVAMGRFSGFHCAASGLPTLSFTWP